MENKIDIDFSKVPIFNDDRTSDPPYHAMPQCENCLHGEWDEEKRTFCKAFPKGVPDDIYYGDHDHTKPYPDDKGIRFQKK
jgi:hypothetical protein